MSNKVDIWREEITRLNEAKETLKVAKKEHLEGLKQINEDIQKINKEISKRYGAIKKVTR